MTTTVLRYDALLFVLVHGSVEFELESPDLRQLDLGQAFAEQHFVAVDVEESQGLTDIPLIAVVVEVLEFGHLLVLADLLVILLLHPLIPFLLKHHLLLSQTARTVSLGIQFL